MPSKRKSMSWYRYCLQDKITGKSHYFGTARQVADHLDFKSTCPINVYMRSECKRKAGATKDRWARFTLTRVFIPDWVNGNQYTIKRKLRALRRTVHTEIHTHGTALNR